MSTLDALLQRIDADLALPAFPPLPSDEPQDHVGAEQAAAAQLLPLGMPERAELLGECPAAPTAARERPQPRLPWWRRWPRRG